MLVDFKTEAVIRQRSVTVGGDDEGEIVDEMRCVAQHVTALAQRVEDKREVHLLEIADATMHKLGTAARGFLGEIAALDEKGAVAARGGFDCGAQAGGATAEHQYIPRLGLAAQIVEDLFSRRHASSSDR